MDGVAGLKGERSVKRAFQNIVERHADGYIAYPLGLRGVVIGQGDTLDDAVADVTSAIEFHIQSFGPGVIEGENEPT